jgi:ribosome modulation factor
MKQIFPATTPFENGWNAFISNDECPYRKKSFYEREWLRGWNKAYMANRQRLSA